MHRGRQTRTVAGTENRRLRRLVKRFETKIENMFRHISSLNKKYSWRKQMVVVNVLGQKLILKRNPWYYGVGKFGEIVKQGLATPHEPFYLATPPPWFEDPTKLSDAQLAVVRDFIKINWEYKGKPLAERLKAIKERMKGKKYSTGERKRRTSVKYLRLPSKVVEELKATAK